jgi:hypothetical protein
MMCHLRTHVVFDGVARGGADAPQAVIAAKCLGPLPLERVLQAALDRPYNPIRGHFRPRANQELAHAGLDQIVLENPHAVRLGRRLDLGQPAAVVGRVMPKQGKCPVQLEGYLAVIERVDSGWRAHGKLAS